MWWEVLREEKKKNSAVACHAAPLPSFPPRHLPQQWNPVPLTNFHLRWCGGGLFPFTLNICLNHWGVERKKNNIWVKLLFAKSFSSHGRTPKSHFIRRNNFEMRCIRAAWLRFWTYMKISDFKWKQNSFTLTAALGRPSGCRMGAKHVSLPW